MPIKNRGQSSSPVKGRRIKLNDDYGLAEVCMNSDDHLDESEDNEILEVEEHDYPQYMNHDDNEEEMMPDFMDDEESDHRSDDLLDDSADEKGEYPIKNAKTAPRQYEIKEEMKSGERNKISTAATNEDISTPSKKKKVVKAHK